MGQVHEERHRADFPVAAAARGSLHSAAFLQSDCLSNSGAGGGVTGLLQSSPRPRALIPVHCSLSSGSSMCSFRLCAFWCFVSWPHPSTLVKERLFETAAGSKARAPWDFLPGEVGFRCVYSSECFLQAELPTFILKLVWNSAAHRGTALLEQHVYSF